MALTIQEVSSNLVKVCKEISQIKEKLSSELTDASKLKELIQECEHHNNELVMEITASKKKKFERDVTGYDSGRVYQWRNQSNHGPNAEGGITHLRNRNYTLNRSTTDLEYDSESSTNSSHTSGSFLDKRQRDGPQLPSGRTKNAGGERAPTTRDPYQTRRRQNRY